MDPYITGGILQQSNYARGEVPSYGYSSTLGTSSTADRLIYFIVNEQAQELLGKLHCWEDLARAEILLTRTPYFNFDAVAIQPYRRLRPIPQTHLERFFRNGQPLGSDQRRDEQIPGY